MFEKIAKSLVAVFLILILAGGILQGLDYNLIAYAGDPVDSWSNHIATGDDIPVKTDSTYNIVNEEQLAWVASQVNNNLDTFSGCTIKINATLNLSAYYWVPIGNTSYSFQGTFDGNNKVISGLTIGSLSVPESTLKYVGLLGNANGAVLKDVCLENIAIYSSYNANSSCIGGLVAYMKGSSTISGCHVSGYLKSNGAYAVVGGLLGSFAGSSTQLLTAKNCYGQCTITGTNLLYVGCLAGNMVGGATSKANIIKNCFASGTIVGGKYGTTYIGGLVGYCKFNKLYNCFSNCLIYGKSGYFGGFAGYGYYSSFSNVYAAGRTSSSSKTGFPGGFLGFPYGSSNTLAYCYWNSSGAFYGTGSKGDAGTATEQSVMQSDSFLSTLNSNVTKLADADLVSWEWDSSKHLGYPKLLGLGDFTTPYAPIAENAAISGTAQVGQTLTVSYDYLDINGYVQSGSIFQWYRSANAEGSAAVPITDANQSTYTPTNDDVSKYIYAAVTSSNGYAIGTTVNSACTSQVEGLHCFAGGSGKDGDPYIITTLDQLKYMTEDPYAYYKLGNDITGLDEVLFIGGQVSQMFNGDLDGDNHTVTLDIEESSDFNVGMFGDIESTGYVHDLNIAGSVSGTKMVGGLAGFSRGKISNCSSSVTVSVTGSNVESAHAGGLVADNLGSITNCSVTGTVKASSLIGNKSAISNALFGGIAAHNQSNASIAGCHTNIATFSVSLSSFYNVYVGGLAGKNEEGASITNCYTDNDLSCNLTTDDEACTVWTGGIAGQNCGANISQCYASSNVTGSGKCAVYTGGVVGECSQGFPSHSSEISESYYSGTVAGNGESNQNICVGGLAGYFDSGEISYCYSTGSVTGDGGSNGIGNVYAGGLIGYNKSGDLIKCYTCSSGTATGGSTGYNGGLYGWSHTSSDSCTTKCYWNKEDTAAKDSDAANSSNLPNSIMATMQMTGVKASSYMSGLDFTTPYFVTKDNQPEYWYYPQLNAFANSTDGKVSADSLESVTAVVYASVINIADIPGITPPAIAVLPKTTTETAQYTGSVCWSPPGIPFSANTVYSAKITLIPKLGYTLDGVNENFFKVAGADSVTNPANSGIVTAVFPATATAAVNSAVISPTTVVFDLDNPDDVSTTVTDWGDAATVTAVVYGSDPLTLSDDFTINGKILTITKKYLSGLNLSAGDTVGLEVFFDAGSSATLTIEAELNHVPGTDASLSDLTVGGSTVSGFAAGQYEYDVELPGDTQPGSAAALVGALPADPEAMVNITQAVTLPGTATVSVTSEDTNTTKTYTIDFTLAAESTYALTVTAETGGNITTGTNGYYAAGTVINIAAAANANYSFDKWTSTGGGIFGSANSANTTFTMPAQSAAITASFTYTGNNSGDGDDGGGSSVINSSSSYLAIVSGNNSAEYSLPVDVNANTATVDISNISGDIFLGKSNTAITIPHISGLDSYTIKIPAASLSSPNGEGAVTFTTEIGSITIPDNMLTGISGIEGKEAAITIGKGDKTSLPEDVKAVIGDRPIIQLTLTIDGKQTEWNNPNAPVTVSIPYTPTESELANSDAIVIWYIDGSGNVVSIPNGHYDPVTGTVTFTTTHFSYYAMGYNKVSFIDVAETAWYSKAVGFIAARCITTGTDNGNFSPEAKLTRGDFLVMLMRAYSIEPDTDLSNNFSDAGNTYFTGYLAAAKRLGISTGVGGNLYAPSMVINRQEMFTLLYNTLKLIGELPESISGKTPVAYSDVDAVAAWAKDAVNLLAETGIIGGDGGKLSPTSTTTRAEMSQVLYNLLSK